MQFWESEAAGCEKASGTWRPTLQQRPGDSSRLGGSRLISPELPHGSDEDEHYPYEDDASCAAPAGALQPVAPPLLLTGATGFLGPCLLEALSREYEGMIYCLVRPPFERVRVPQAATDRVKLIAANLESEGLGLSSADATTLQAAGIWLIVHNGAAVDHVRPYSALKACNVEAGDALLDLLSTGSHAAAHPPAFIFVSSLSALAPGDGAEAIDATPSTRVNLLGGGYGKSKWVAEHRLARAAADGRLRALGVARLGRSGTFVLRCGHNDWLHLFLRAVAASRATRYRWRGHAAAIALLPVDLAAAAVVKLAKAVADSEGGRGRGSDAV